MSNNVISRLNKHFVNNYITNKTIIIIVNGFMLKNVLIFYLFCLNT